MERSEAPYGSTASNSVDIVAHNIWNSIMELLFHVQISAASSKSVEGIDLAGVAMSCHLSSVAIRAQAISCSNVRGVVPVHEMFWFCLVQVSSTAFCSFPPVLMASVDDGSHVLISPVRGSPVRGTSSNYGCPKWFWP